MTGETVACTDELPWDLSAALDELEDRSMGRTEAGERIIPQLNMYV